MKVQSLEHWTNHNMIPPTLFLKHNNMILHSGIIFPFFSFSMNGYGHPLLLQPSISYLFAIFFYIFIIYKNTDSGLDASLMIQW